MSTEAREVEKLMTVHAHRFRVDEYHQMIDAGILTEDHRVELLEGVIVEMSPVGARHRAVVTRLYELLSRLVPEGWHVACQQPVTLANSEPEPDLSIVRGKSLDYLDSLPLAGDIGLLVEVAETSLATDLQQKAAIYASSGIPGYWIIDIVGNDVHCLREPQSGDYRSRKSFARTDELTCDLDGERVGVLSIAEFLPG